MTTLDEFRAGGIFPTNVAQAATGRYGGLYALVGRKLGLIPRDPENAAMRRGHAWETRVSDIAATATGMHVVGEQAWVQHPTMERHRAIVDGFLSATPQAGPSDLAALLEDKTRGAAARGPAPWDYYVAQTQWGLHVCGLDRALVVLAFIDDAADDDSTAMRGITLRWIDRDDDLIAGLIEVADRIAWHIDNQTMPDPDDHTSVEAVKAVTATADPSLPAVDLDLIAAQVRRFGELRRAIKAAEDERKNLEITIRATLGDATKGVTSDGWSATISAPRQIVTAEAAEQILADHPELGKFVLDVERAKAEKPDVYSAARTASGARVLTVREPKESPSP